MSHRGLGEVPSKDVSGALQRTICQVAYLSGTNRAPLAPRGAAGTMWQNAPAMPSGAKGVRGGGDGEGGE